MATRFWCLLINCQKEVIEGPFVFAVENTLDVAGLKKRVKDELPIVLRDVSAHQLALWKPSMDISLDISPLQLETAIAGLNFPDPDSKDEATDDVNLLRPVRKVSTYWATTPEEGCLHIIARVPQGETSSRKRPRVESPALKEDETERQYQIAYRLWAGLWKQGKNAWTDISTVVKDDVPDFMVPDSKTTEAQATLVDLTSFLSWTPVDQEWRLLTPRFLVRDDYTEFDNYLDGEIYNRHILLVGQPGIGKTVYLTYCLLKRLIAGRPTIYAATHHHYVFLDSGVYHMEQPFDDSRDQAFVNQHQDALVLFDLNERQRDTAQFKNWRILVSSLPQPNRYKQWVKYANAQTYVMSTWSWTEVFLARNIAAIQQPPEVLYATYVKYGGTARTLFSRPQSDVDNDISKAINNCTNINSLFPVTEFQDNTSHALIAINPYVNEDGVLDRTQFQGQIASRYILQQLMERKHAELAKGMKDTFTDLFQFGGTRSASGILFEGAGHQYLFNALASPLHIRSLLDSKKVSVNLHHVQDFNHFNPPDIHAFNELNPNYYYQPLSTTTAGIDSFALEVNKDQKPITVVLFQFTTAMNHPINDHFLPSLWIKHTKAKTMVKWKLVFVVPLKNEPGFCIQEWKSEAAKDTWGHRISQYVLGVDPEKLWDASGQFCRRLI